MDQPCGFLADQQLPAPAPAPLPDPVPLASTAVTLKIAGSLRRLMPVAPLERRREGISCSSSSSRSIDGAWSLGRE